MSPKSRVPVSTQVTHRPKDEILTLRIGQNPLHERSLVETLCSDYNWRLCADGNLYAPRPQALEGERDAA
jgi:hypothetical protein